MGRFNIGNFTVDGTFVHLNLDRLKSLPMKTYIVPPSEATRPDLIADTIYRNVELKSMLLAINNIVDLQQLGFGFKLKYPEIKDIITVLNEVEENS